MSKALELTSESFTKEVLESKGLVLVDFWAPWCGPCQMMAPVLDELSVEFEGKIKITKLDVENSGNQPIAAQYEIMSIPALKLFKDGKVIKEFVGFRPKDALKKELEEIL